MLSSVNGAKSSGQDRRKVFILLGQRISIEDLIVNVFLVGLRTSEVSWFWVASQDGERDDCFVLDSSNCLLWVDPWQIVVVNLFEMKS